MTNTRTLSRSRPVPSPKCSPSLLSSLSQLYSLTYSLRFAISCQSYLMYERVIISANGTKWTLEEIVRLVVLSVWPSVCLNTRWLIVISTCHTQPAGTVAPSCENFYIGEDMHCHEPLSILYLFYNTYNACFNNNDNVRQRRLYCWPVNNNMQYNGKKYN